MYMYTIKERRDNKKKQEMRRRETNKLRGEIVIHKVIEYTAGMYMYM